MLIRCTGNDYWHIASLYACSAVEKFSIAGFVVRGQGWGREVLRSPTEKRCRLMHPWRWGRSESGPRLYPWGGSASVRSGTGAEAAAGAAMIGEIQAVRAVMEQGCCRSVEVGGATQSLTACSAFSSPARASHGSGDSTTTISSNHFIFHRR
jgi:hypothetical protein